VLPQLWSTTAVPAIDSTHGTLPTMSGYDSPLSLIHWVLDFALAPLFPLVFCQEISIRLPLSLDFWLVLAGFFVVQSIHIHQSDGGFDWMCALNSK
jgi:hypothetical protein